MKKSLELVLVAKFGNGDEGVYKIKKFKIPGRQDDEQFEEHVREILKEMKDAISYHEYDQGLPRAGMESGSW